jgi:hypothetical protein
METPERIASCVDFRSRFPMLIAGNVRCRHLRFPCIIYMTLAIPGKEETESGENNGANIGAIRFPVVSPAMQTILVLEENYHDGCAAHPNTRVDAF